MANSFGVKILSQSNLENCMQIFEMCSVIRNCYLKSQNCCVTSFTVARLYLGHNHVKNSKPNKREVLCLQIKLPTLCILYM